MDTVFVSFDYENDKHYKYLLEAWHANPKFRFVFEDGTPTEIDSTNVGRIKAALTTKVKAATHTLVIVGKYANDRHRQSSLIGYKNWINFEIHQSAQEGKRIAVVRLDRSNELPEELRSVHHSLVEGFSESNVTYALNTAPYQFQRYAL
jgi:hypothetical protein